MLPLLILLSLPSGALQGIGVSLIIATVWAALFYLFASFTQAPSHKAIANEELAALLLTIFIIFFWLSFDYFLQDAVAALVNISQSSVNQQTGYQGLPLAHINLALLQLEVFLNELVSLYLRLSLIDFFLGFMSTLSFNIGTLPGGIGFFSLHISPYGGLGLISSALTSIVDGVGLLALATWGKILFLLFAKNVIPLIFLPLGILMRAFPFTRTTGSTIIAVAFAIYFVYPLAVMLSFHAIFDVYGLKFDYNYIEQASPFTKQMSDTDISTMVGDIAKGDKDIQQGRSGQPSGMYSDPHGAEAKQTAENACGITSSDSSITKAIKYMLCAVDKLIKATSSYVPVIGDFIKTVWDTAKQMLNYSGGFLSFLFSPTGGILFPASMTLGWYVYLTTQIAKTAELFVVTTISSVLEIMIVITAYRNISMLIGGEAELPGLSKLV